MLVHARGGGRCSFDCVSLKALIRCILRVIFALASPPQRPPEPSRERWRGAALARICHGAAVGHLMEFLLLLMGQGQWEVGLMTPESAQILPITQR